MKNFLIGLFLIAGLGVFAGLVLFLRPTIGDQKQTLHVRFANINKVSVGTRVLFAGKPVGIVGSIEEIRHARETQPSDELGRLFFYQLTLNIDSLVHVYSTDEIRLQTSGLLGERFIAIVPKTPAKGETPEMITDKTPFYADSIDPIENTFNRISEIGENLNTTVAMVKTWFEDNGGKITQAVNSFGSAMAQIDTISQSVNELQLIPQIKEGTAAITTSMEKVDIALAKLHEAAVFENLGPMVNNLKSVSASVDKLCQNMTEGQGTMGKLMQGNDMYLRMTAVMSKMDTLMNDVNHYGVLFHLNKGWQRTRVKRAAALSALETPDSFKTYFQTEIDQINTSMARLSILIDKAQNENKAVENQKFQQNFSELMQQVETMSSNLHLYNEQLQQAKP